jgi:hypothetical protein
VCAILEVAASLSGCEVLRGACEEACAQCLEYLISPPTAEYHELDYCSIATILQVRCWGNCRGVWTLRAFDAIADRQ